MYYLDDSPDPPRCTQGVLEMDENKVFHRVLGEVPPSNFVRGLLNIESIGSALAIEVVIGDDGSEYAFAHHDPVLGTCAVGFSYESDTDLNGPMPQSNIACRPKHLFGSHSAEDVPSPAVEKYFTTDQCQGRGYDLGIHFYHSPPQHIAYGEDLYALDSVQKNSDYVYQKRDGECELDVQTSMYNVYHAYANFDYLYQRGEKVSAPAFPVVDLTLVSAYGFDHVVAMVDENTASPVQMGASRLPAAYNLKWPGIADTQCTFYHGEKAGDYYCIPTRRVTSLEDNYAIYSDENCKNRLAEKNEGTAAPVVAYKRSAHAHFCEATFFGSLSDVYEITGPFDGGRYYKWSYDRTTCESHLVNREVYDYYHIGKSILREFPVFKEEIDRE